ncbi:MULTISPECIES: hydrogenase maturation nickel metallochaperone HypA [Streptomyces]|uniref:Hydrogenase maturation factor HypA n=1 Tax=Streptomyces caniscabiei TaxID=2746961 RepID=A0ABU4N4Z7_9ACTN|nr:MULTISPECIES: hydrogenase maturation nickel metallochaperone HypA [Streptomyces]MBE4737333.1 hydrogenase maturation nickel metallochaperone HypA [Streptomyces caniscabiei]MBE4756093.1 hydrogenase maturation nickel metallochaperone HypA [Streptomyces caniscabiei]MBE4769890.1 hydrogenase maturation nickel metallochaperone HypA [Streptomyces caniscabiei]MBE4787164.1 hydrogenase maturation nickel metallochaperone HypA [Streptomyces caniscabiei]MBE4795431.1 hydrogenase maturation nickel metalloc
MHEMSVALAVVDQVAEAADRAGDITAVRSVRLQVGELAGVVPDSLTFCFELACSGTLLEGAELITEAVPGRARCTPCAHEWAVGMPPQLTCPACGGTRTDLLAGRELSIVDVRWEDGGPAQPPTREPISEES